MLTPPVDEKLSYWLFTVSLTDEEKNELNKSKTKFDRVVKYVTKFNLTDEELIEEKPQESTTDSTTDSITDGSDETKVKENLGTF